MPRYVLLRHECPSDYEKPSHWDFMVEQDGVLLTWEVRDLPRRWGEQLALESCDATTVHVLRLADHRLAYLDFEGPISDDRGSVVRVDRGEYELVRQDDAGLEINLVSGKLRGMVKLAVDEGEWWLAALASG